MDNQELARAFSDLATPQLVDAGMRLDRPVLVAPVGIGPLLDTSRLAGRVLGVRHYGSVDVFLEAFAGAAPGDVLVVDNGGRTDEGCIGDLTALEARAAGLAGLVVWGLHRDTRELREIGLPVFSYGAVPSGPRRLDPREADAMESARFGDFQVGRSHVVFADSDGVLFVSREDVGVLLETASGIRETERRQARMIEEGTTLREQLKFDEYLRKRSSDAGYSFRDHLRAVGGEIEE